MFDQEFWLKRYGLKKGDALPVLLSYKVMSSVYFVGLCAGMYRFRPLQKLYAMPQVKTAVTKFRNQYPRVDGFVLKSKNGIESFLAKNRYFSQIPMKMGLQSQLFAKAFVESAVVFKLSVPITLPLFMYAFC